MEVCGKEVHDNIYSEEQIDQIVDLLGDLIFVEVPSPLEAYFNGQLDTVVDGKANNEHVPLDSDWMIQFNDLFLPKPFHV